MRASESERARERERERERERHTHTLEEGRRDRLSGERAARGGGKLPRKMRSGEKKWTSMKGEKWSERHSFVRFVRDSPSLSPTRNDT